MYICIQRQKEEEQVRGIITDMPRGVSHMIGAGDLKGYLNRYYI